MQSTRNLVGILVELAARVKRRHHNLQGGYLLFRMDVDGDSTSVIFDSDRVVPIDRDDDRVAVTTKRLVDRVVDYFKNKVVESANANVADVHRRSLADRIESFENLDVGGAIGCSSLGFFACFVCRHKGPS